MKTATVLPATEEAIWARIVQPEAGGYSSAAAQIILDLDFSPTDRCRMDDLADKAAAGNLTSRERSEAESYNRIAHLLALLQSRARQSLGARKQR